MQDPNQFYGMNRPPVHTANLDLDPIRCLLHLVDRGGGSS
jgi:hypothetical protein